MARTRGGVPDGSSTTDDSACDESGSRMSSLRQPGPDDQSTGHARHARLRALDATPNRRRRGGRRLEGYRGALLLALIATALIAVVWLAPVETLDASGDAVAWLEAHQTPTAQAIASVALGALALLGLVIAWGRRTALGRPVHLPAGGQITVAEIARRLEALIEEREGVHRAEVHVDNLHRRGVRVTSRIHVDPQANLSGAIEAVSEAAELLLHGHLLVRLSSPPSVELRFDELDLRSGRVDDQRTSAAHR